MLEQIFKYMFADFLLDPRIKKEFPENGDADSINTRLAEYFDIAISRKGYNFLKQQYDRQPPKFYVDQKKKIVSTFYKLLDSNGVFTIERHTFFGVRCSVDSERFIYVISEQKGLVSISDGMPLDNEIKRWGVVRLKSGLKSLYQESGGFFDASKWIDFYDESMMPESTDQSVEIPASDRIVPVDHNSASVADIIDASKKLQESLLAANDIGAMGVGQAHAAAVEVGQISAAFAADFIRADRMFARAKETLAWIGKEAAGALVGAAALALLALIAAYLGFSL